jgi:DNA-binding transcriptional LysR family regulator
MKKSLEFVHAVQEVRTLSFAARRLHMSQAQFLARLLEVDSEGGLRLVKVGKTLELTATARRLLPSRLEPGSKWPQAAPGE